MTNIPAPCDTASAFAPPGSPTIRNVNWGGLKTLYLKEVRRFLKVQLQTVWAPAINSLLFLVIFTVAQGRGGRLMGGVPFADFIAPGLIIMSMMQQSFANSSFALLVAKVQGTIVDYLMPPLSAGELLSAMVGAAVTRAVMVGGASWLVMLIWPGVHMWVQHPVEVIFFGLAGSMLLAFMGVLTSMWAEKFDHTTTIANFVVAPLALLSGTFYSIDRLAPIFATISRINPFHYAISGFRYGFIGTADSPLATGVSYLLTLDLVLGLACYILLRRGWKLRN
ncbi:MAG: ABC transporter permease [Alphaproteobacteria bacterium]|nr:ABC transporter permease [Alphaproteobacteria bacterium]MDE2340301.1 ABC transporter permease [Alphaproteobacteria bacterium]